MLWQRFSSLVFWAFLVSSSIALFPFAVLVWAATVLFDRRLVPAPPLHLLLGVALHLVNPQWPMTIAGREKIRDDTTYVMVANHLSLLDILVLFRIFKHFKWGLEDREFQGAVRRLEHDPEPLRQAAPRRSRERQADDGGL